jgi:hypothetical protein
MENEFTGISQHAIQHDAGGSDPVLAPANPDTVLLNVENDGDTLYVEVTGVGGMTLLSPNGDNLWSGATAHMRATVAAAYVSGILGTIINDLASGYCDILGPDGNDILVGHHAGGTTDGTMYISAKESGDALVLESLKKAGKSGVSGDIRITADAGGGIIYIGYGAPGAPTQKDPTKIFFDNAGTALTADEVGDAIRELDARVTALEP